jgi:hypothetical protein
MKRKKIGRQFQGGRGKGDIELFPYNLPKIR